MSILIAFIITFAIISLLGKLYSVFKDKIQFLITGMDSGFSINELVLLWKVAELCNLAEPNSLFWSLPALSKCMTELTLKTKSSNAENADKYQAILSKLFNFRTKVQNEHDAKKGLSSSRDLEAGQRLRIILPGNGVFASEIVNNGSNITIMIPRQGNLIPVPAQDWVNHTVKVYLWRNSDASYSFDTTVMGQGIFLGKLCLYLKHSSDMIRTQKRQAVRAKCNIHANLFFVNADNFDSGTVETSGGFKCIMEDVSECGALIRIGGKGNPNVKIKLQFTINNKLVIMYGIIRNVEYNPNINQSRLHFECLKIDENMKNDILTYVYDTLPQDEKEIFDALTLTASDEKEDIAETIALDKYRNGNSNGGGETSAGATVTMNAPVIDMRAGKEEEITVSEPSEVSPEIEINNDLEPISDDAINVFAESNG